MKRLLLNLCTIALCVAFCSCTSVKDSTDGEIYFPTKSEKESVMSAEMIIPKNMSELYDTAHSIVVCDIIKDDESIQNGSVDLAISTARIVEVIKGDHQKNTDILIQETGERLQDGDISIDGVPLLRKNMKVLLFLNKPTTENYNGKTTYGIVGCYYGKFFYDNNKTVHSAVDFAVDNATELSDFKQPQKEQIVLTSIEEISKTYK